MQITSSSTWLVKADYYSEFIPGISTVTSLIDLFLKHVVVPRSSQETLRKSHYFNYLDRFKPTVRCLVLLVPVIGNLFIGLAEFYMAKEGQNQLKKAQSNTSKDDVVNAYKEATKFNNVDALYLYGTCFEKGTGVRQDPGKAKGYYRYAAIWGHPQAQEALARLR